MKFRNIIWILFIGISLLELLSQIFYWETVNLIAKPLLMPLLAIGFIKSVNKSPKFSKMLLLALLFSWFGDISLMFQASSSNYFIIGLVSFLIAHIAYIYLFKKTSQDFKPKAFTYSTGFLLFVYGGLLLMLLWTGLGNMMIPVIVYTVVIMIMGITALFRKAEGASFILIGAMLFIASDSLIAINKFFEPIEAARFWIMLTYILAQYLIVSGMIKYFSKNPETYDISS